MSPHRPRLLTSAVVAVVGLVGCAPAALEVRVDSSGPTFSSVATEPADRAQESHDQAATSKFSTDDWAALIRSADIVPEELHQTILECGDFCGVTSVQPVMIDGIETGVVLVQISGYNGLEGTVLASIEAEGPLIIMAHYGADSWVEVIDGVLTLQRKMYAPDDPESDPSGPTEVTTYVWNGSHFMLDRRVGGGTGYAPFLPTDRVVIA